MRVYPPTDTTQQIVRDNFTRIRLFAIDGTVLTDPGPRERLLCLLRNRCRFRLRRPLVLVAVHDQDEQAAAESFRDGPASQLARIRVVHQRYHTETIGNAIRTYQDYLDPAADRATAKRHILVLGWRGGAGQPQFVEPFLGGQGTTCGEWTRVVDRGPDGTTTKGFMKAALVVGFCPVECPFCYLQTPYLDGMTVYLNWEALAEELYNDWRAFPQPINFSETSGLVEYDEWFAGPAGEGSMVQYVIDACAQARVRPFFLTKIRYPRYLRFHGQVQVGISLMPEPVRQHMAPHGSPSEELLDSLGWAVENGAVDPVIRLFVLWEHRDLYGPLLEQCRDRLGTTGWRLTLDIPRFTPMTASIIGRQHPQAAEQFAREIAPDDDRPLGELARGAAGEKKLRPTVERQATIFRWFRDELLRIGCGDLILTPCKADPAELLPLVQDGTVDAMPCACHRPSSSESELVQLRPSITPELPGGR